MNTQIQKACAWCGPFVVLVCGIGLFALARFVPPPSPMQSAHDVARTYAENPFRIRLGLTLTVFGSALLGPWFSVISGQMRRIEGRQSPLASCQLAMGTLLIAEFLFPLMALQAAGYRPDRPEEVIRGLSDLGWMTFYGVTGTAVVQAAVIGVVILTDERPIPLFPRWSGYFNFWVAAAFVPGAILMFFKQGPFAWNGLFVFWLPFGVFFSWIVIMTALLLKAIDRGDNQVPEGSSGAPEVEVDWLASRSSGLADELADLRKQRVT